jgi:hypothetical protein
MLSPRRVIIADQCFSSIFPTGNQRGSSVVRAGISTNPASAQRFWASSISMPCLRLFSATRPLEELESRPVHPTTSICAMLFTTADFDASRQPISHFALQPSHNPGDDEVEDQVPRITINGVALSESEAQMVCLALCGNIGPTEQGNQSVLTPGHPPLNRLPRFADSS